MCRGRQAVSGEIASLPDLDHLSSGERGCEEDRGGCLDDKRQHGGRGRWRDEDGGGERERRLLQRRRLPVYVYSSIGKGVVGEVGSDEGEEEIEPGL